MTMYVYDTGGEPVGFVFETSIYGLDGQPLGRILGSRVHRFDGSYVGEWFHQMVVERPDGHPRWIPAVTPPPARRGPGASYRRRAVAEYRAYRDAFDELARPANPLTEAAE